MRPKALLLCVNLLLLLSACGNGDARPSGSNGTVAPQNPNPTPVVDGRAPAPTPPQDDDAPARAAFLHTFASGQKSWAIRNAVVVYSRTEKNALKEKWTSTCAAGGPISLAGSYPNLTVRMTRFDCGPNHQAPEFTKLHLITNVMDYRARFIPAGDTEPNQFGLSLTRSENSGFIRWESQESLNALTKDHVVFLDFSGEEKGEIDFAGNRHHYVTISLREGEHGAGDKLVMEYNLDGSDERSEISISADLIRN
ncbi:MAG: hypothetical protein ACXWR1_15445 [Bdellovibrionota bacterium]